MTREEAIEIIECGEISNRWGKDGEEVEKMAIEALKQKPCEDAISRQAVLEEINRVGVKGFETYNDYSQLFDFVDTLPPVNPQKPICPSAGVDCEDCPAYEDAISREAALDAIEDDARCGVYSHFASYDDAQAFKNYIKDLPSVSSSEKPKSEWQHDHEILRAYSDGANAVLDKIRAEIEQTEINGHIRDVECFRAGIDIALNVIDKYKAEGSDKE